MCLIRIRTGLWWNFNLKKRFQLVKTIRLSTHSDIFVKKNFGVGGQKSKFCIRFYDVKSPEILIFDTQTVEKCSVRGVLTNFNKKVPFWGSYIPLKHFSCLPLNLSCQDTSFKHPYGHILSDDFLTKKVGKLVKTQKFC